MPDRVEAGIGTQARQKGATGIPAVRVEGGCGGMQFRQGVKPGQFHKFRSSLHDCQQSLCARLGFQFGIVALAMQFMPMGDQISPQQPPPGRQAFWADPGIGSLAKAGFRPAIKKSGSRKRDRHTRRPPSRRWETCQTAKLLLRHASMTKSRRSAAYCRGARRAVQSHISKDFQTH